MKNPVGQKCCSSSEVPEPQPGPGEVLIDVVAAGVNRADSTPTARTLSTSTRRFAGAGTGVFGAHQCTRTRRRRMGSRRRGVRAADRWWVRRAGGRYQSGQLLTVPSGVSLVEAAALPEAACTVWSNLVMAADLSRGEAMLVHGGGSGIGTMAIQVARMRGAVPMVTVGSDRKAEFCRDPWCRGGHQSP